MSGFENQNGLYNKDETALKNRTNNNNKRNNALTEYFDKLLKSNEFHKIIIVLLGGGVMCIILILAFIVVQLFICGTISSALDLLYKIGVPIIAFLMFIIKFGDRSYKGGINI